MHEPRVEWLRVNAPLLLPSGGSCQVHVSLCGRVRARAKVFNSTSAASRRRHLSYTAEMTTSLVASTRDSFLWRVAEWQPAELQSCEVAINRLIDWSESHGPLVALPADDQDTVAFGISKDRVLWRAYPGKTVPTKIAILPGLRTDLHPSTRASLVAALEAAVPGVAIAASGHLQCPLVPLSDVACLERFGVFLAAALAAGRAHKSTAA